MRWGRIIGGALLLELVLILVLVPPLQFLGPAKVIPFAGPVVLIVGFLVTWWILRKVPQRAVLNGALIGILATIIYILMCMANPQGISSVVAMYGTAFFIIANGLRIVGCTAGGYYLARKATLVRASS
jgi:hypothetical protein